MFWFLHSKRLIANFGNYVNQWITFIKMCIEFWKAFDTICIRRVQNRVEMWSTCFWLRGGIRASSWYSSRDSTNDSLINKHDVFNLDQFSTTGRMRWVWILKNLTHQILRPVRLKGITNRIPYQITKVFHHSCLHPQGSNPRECWLAPTIQGSWLTEWLVPNPRLTSCTIQDLTDSCLQSKIDSWLQSRIWLTREQSRIVDWLLQDSWLTRDYNPRCCIMQSEHIYATSLSEFSRKYFFAKIQSVFGSIYLVDFN